MRRCFFLLITLHTGLAFVFNKCVCKIGVEVRILLICVMALSIEHLQARVVTADFALILLVQYIRRATCAHGQICARTHLE
jgi:hypothetical protein